ncbi:MAG: site-specific integrase [Oscillospiraceae bacterium]|nr:site-specific integrase [Oscillospiraceae bacterium]
MATAKKQPSGMWKVRVYSHTDESGKQHMRAFTAPTKAEAEAMAAAFQGKADRTAQGDPTVEEALERYVTAKTAVLSPKTVREYRGMMGRYYDTLAKTRIRKITSIMLQEWVSKLTEQVSAKTVRNAYGLLLSAITLHLPDASYKVTLPARPKRRTSAPEDDQVRVLFERASSWLKICIALAAFGSLRRGEISALTYGDIDGSVIHVSRDMVQDSASRWIIKDMPKTSDSIRDVPVPQEVIALIGSGAPDQIIVPRNPNVITMAFGRLRDSLGLSVRFHDLRHYYASIGAVIGIPDVYLAQFGGWRPGSPVLKQIYQNRIDTAAAQYAGAMTGHFSKILTQNLT